MEKEKELQLRDLKINDTTLFRLLGEEDFEKIINFINSEFVSCDNENKIYQSGHADGYSEGYDEGYRSGSYDERIENKEKFKELCIIGKKMNYQDNCATQFPLFAIMEDVKIYSECGDLRERVDEDSGDFDDNYLCKDCLLKHENGEELPEECEHCDEDAFEYFYYEPRISDQAGVFFTSEAANDHIKNNNYHYLNPRVFAISAWRNPEMQTVLEILSSIGNTENKPLSHYKKYE